MSDKNTTASLRAPYAKSVGLPGLSNVAQKRGMDNNCPLRVLNADNSEVYDVASMDPANHLQIGGSYWRRLLRPVVLPIQAQASITTTPIFLNNDTDTLELANISCSFGTANGAALTAYISHEPATSGAPGSGASTMSGTFNLNSTANTIQEATMAGTRGYPTLVLKPGDQLSLVLSTTTTSLADLVITLWFRGLNGPVATYIRSANGDIADGTMFLSPMSGLKVRKVAMRWGTAGTNGSAVTGDIKKDTGTQAPVAGTTILAATQSLKATANNTVYPALSATASDYTLAQTDRLSFDVTGTLTALANLIVTVFFEPVAQDWIMVPFSTWDAVTADRDIWIANGFYRFIGAYFTWSTASASGTIDLKKAGDGTALASGTSVVNATVSSAATANTPLPAIPLSSNAFTPIIANGQRLALDQGGTLTSLAGLFGVVVLGKF